MYLREQDRAILVERNPKIMTQLNARVDGDRRFKLINKDIQPTLVKRLLPPLSKRGLVTLDLDLMVPQVRVCIARHVIEFVFSDFSSFLLVFVVDVFVCVHSCVWGNLGGAGTRTELS